MVILNCFFYANLCFIVVINLVFYIFHEIKNHLPYLGRDITGFKKLIQYSFLNSIISPLQNLNTGGCPGNGVYIYIHHNKVLTLNGVFYCIIF